MNTRNLISKAARGKMKAVIPSEDILAGHKELSAAGFALMIYYYSKNDIWDWKDETMMSELGWNLRKLKETRAELIKKRYLKVDKTHDTTYNMIGRQSVALNYRKEE